MVRGVFRQRPLAVRPAGRGFDPAESPEARRSLLIAIAVAAVLFALLLTRLWYLQILQGDHFRKLSEHNRIRVVDVPPSRGRIFDAKGRLLADNRPAFTLAVIPEDVDDWDALKERLQKLVGVAPEEVDKARAAARGQAPFKPIRLRAHLDRQALAVLETFRYELVGVKVLVEYLRAYHAANETAHVVGYLGEINRRELEKAPKGLYRMGDFVGRYGLERSRERMLHGRRGARSVEVDAVGRELEVLEEIPPVAGQTLVLSLDLDLQQAAARAMDGRVGAVAALSPKTGEIFCLYSSPSFDQNQFIMGMTPEQWKELKDNPLHPLKDRAISGMYPPGSTYKIVTATAGLAEGVVTPQKTFYCDGEIRLGRRTYKCWRYKWGGHGNTDLHKALRESCDVYFYRVGQRLGVDRLAKWARAFGLGRPTGVALPHEAAGLVPDSKWKERRFGEPWQEGETLSVAIGQGFNLMTPLQLARMVAVVANGGRLVTPRLVKAVVPPDGGDPVPEPKGVEARVDVPANALLEVHKGLVAVVNEPHGTARRARLPEITVAGKTGTAQVVALKVQKAHGGEDKVPWKYRDHALFVAYAPAEDPEIAVAVVVEHGGHGGSDAAPVAAEVLRAYFGLPAKMKPGDHAAERPAVGEDGEIEEAGAQDEAAGEEPPAEEATGD